MIVENPKFRTLVTSFSRKQGRLADILIIWTDCDREGENIGGEILKCVRGVKPRIDTYRARFSEITPAAIRRAMNNLVRLDEKIIEAVDCRQELDLRIGSLLFST